jgi:hypothetical protein
MHLTTPLLTTLSLLTLSTATAIPSPRGIKESRITGTSGFEGMQAGQLDVLHADTDDFSSSGCVKTTNAVTYVSLFDGVRCKFSQ